MRASPRPTRSRPPTAAPSRAARGQALFEGQYSIHAWASARKPVCARYYELALNARRRRAHAARLFLPMTHRRHSRKKFGPAADSIAPKRSICTCTPRPRSWASSPTRSAPASIPAASSPTSSTATSTTPTSASRAATSARSIARSARPRATSSASRRSSGRSTRPSRSAAGSCCCRAATTPICRSQWYEDLFRAVKERYPAFRLHALSPPEVIHLSRMSRLPVPQVIDRLIAAGLDSIPGGGAEILVDRVRKLLNCYGKATADEWLDVMRHAHRAGLRTTATMMYGTVETRRSGWNTCSGCATCRTKWAGSPRSSPGLPHAMGGLVARRDRGAPQAHRGPRAPLRRGARRFQGQRQAGRDRQPARQGRHSC